MSSNSRSASAVVTQGSGSVTANPVTAVGGITGSGYAAGTTKLPYSVAQSDPFSALRDPQTTDCANAAASPTAAGGNGGGNGRGNGGGNTPTPVGTAGGSSAYTSLDLNGDFVLSGTIYICGGDMSVNANSTITSGTGGVTLIFTSATPGSGTVGRINQWNGGAQINLTAPTTGPYANVLAYQDRRAPANTGASQVAGNNQSSLAGAFYFPRSQMDITGNAGFNTNCIRLVARTLEFAGSVTINNTVAAGCPTVGGTDFTGTRVRLVV